MNERRRLSRIAILVATAIVAAPAWADNELEIACEGIESNGGGATRYQYSLRNASANLLMLDYFYLGTTDLVVANYSSWVAPSGYATTGTVGDYVTLDATFPITFSQMFTTGLKTPHGVVPPQTGPATPGAIVWQCTNPFHCSLNPGQVFTFGFDNPNPSNDVEWLTDQLTSISQGFSTQPTAGPLAVFTNGWVHSPVESEAVPAASLWALLLLAGVLAAILALLSYRSQQVRGGNPTLR